MILLEDEKKAVPMTQSIGTVNGPVFQQGSGSIPQHKKRRISNGLELAHERLILSLPAINSVPPMSLKVLKMTWNPLQEQIYSSAPEKSRMQKALAGIKEIFQ